MVGAGGVWVEHEDLGVGRFTYVRVWVEAGREVGVNGGAVWVEADREGGIEGESFDDTATGAASSPMHGSAN